MIQTLLALLSSEPSLLDRLKSGVEKNPQGWSRTWRPRWAGRKEIDADLLEELEIHAPGRDIGIKTPPRRSWRSSASAWTASCGRRQELRQAHLQSLDRGAASHRRRCRDWPNLRAVVLVVGVNGNRQDHHHRKLARL